MLYGTAPTLAFLSAPAHKHTSDTMKALLFASPNAQMALYLECLDVLDKMTMKWSKVKKDEDTGGMPRAVTCDVFKMLDALGFPLDSDHDLNATLSTCCAYAPVIKIAVAYGLAFNLQCFLHEEQPLFPSHRVEYATRLSTVRTLSKSATMKDFSSPNFTLGNSRMVTLL